LGGWGVVDLETPIGLEEYSQDPANAKIGVGGTPGVS